jgi:hypothetical protein
VVTKLGSVEEFANLIKWKLNQKNKINLTLSASVAGASTESGGKTMSTQVLLTTQQLSTLKTVMCVVLVPTVQRPGILVTWSRLGLNTQL